MTLTEEEANEFVVDVLKLSNARERLERNRPDFLDDLIEAFYSSVPFQNVTLLSQPAEERRVPTWEDIKAAVNGGYGGLCYTLSAFMNAILTALGYDTYLDRWWLRTVRRPYSHAGYRKRPYDKRKFAPGRCPRLPYVSSHSARLREGIACLPPFCLPVQVHQGGFQGYLANASTRIRAGTSACARA